MKEACILLTEGLLTSILHTVLGTAEPQSGTKMQPIQHSILLFAGMPAPIVTSVTVLQYITARSPTAFHCGVVLLLLLVLPLDRKITARYSTQCRRSGAPNHSDQSHQEFQCVRAFPHHIRLSLETTHLSHETNHPAVALSTYYNETLRYSAYNTRSQVRFKFFMTPIWTLRPI